jgi:hypothetical protein
LGNLMGGTKPVSEPRETAHDPSRVSPGMATLLQGHKKEVNGAAEEEQAQGRPEAEPEGSSAEESPRSRRLIRTSLFVADGLLVALAARVALKSGGSFGLAEATLCAGALAMGAWLTVVALRMKR